MRTALLFFILALLLFSCKKDDPPTACFNHDPDTNIFVGDTIRFTNCSSGADEYYWDFGDTSISVEKEPFHVYEKAGSYNIKMIASSDYQSDTMAIQIMIHSNNTEACFSFAPDSNIFAGDTVYFTNCTSGQGTYTWDFGDNQTSLEKNPYHVYDTSGQYTVILNVNYNDSTFSTSQIITVLGTQINHEHLIINTSANIDKIVEVNQGITASEYEDVNSISLDLDINNTNDIKLTASYYYYHFICNSVAGSHLLSNEFMVDFDSVYDKFISYSRTLPTGNGDSVTFNYYENYDPEKVYPPDAVIDSSLGVYPAIHYSGDILNNENHWMSVSGILGKYNGLDTYDQVRMRTGFWRENHGFLAIKMLDGGRTRFGWIEMFAKQSASDSIIYIYRYYLQD